MTYKILWATADCFMAHDIVIVPLIAQTCKIHWVIMMPEVGSRYKETDFEDFTKNNPNLHITFVYSSCRIRNPKTITYYNHVYSIFKNEDFDIVHLDIWDYNPWILHLLYKLPKEKTVLVLHQGTIHDGMAHKKIFMWIRKIMMKRIKYLKMYSKSQSSLLHNSFPKAKVFQFNLPLLDFGKPTIERKLNGSMKFLSFGIINYAKNIDLLIEAANILYEKGVRDFIVSINGVCKDWEWYEKKIKYPQVFDNHIRMIGNDEIANLFNACHYFVQPYRIVTQSGPMKIAFNYNLPVIATDLPGFSDEIEENVNGFLFRPCNAKDLADKMEMVIKKGYSYYHELLEKEKSFTEMNYSNEMMIHKHLNMFEEICKNLI